MPGMIQPVRVKKVCRISCSKPGYRKGQCSPKSVEALIFRLPEDDGKIVKKAGQGASTLDRRKVYKRRHAKQARQQGRIVLHNMSE